MYAKPISISRLSEVNEQVRVYIERLKSAVVGHSPRMEMEIYEFTTSFLRDHFERRTDSEETEYESRLAVSRHLQVLFASLLFLIDEEIAGRAEVNLSHQIDTSCNNRSSYYIDSTQRTIALRYFFHLVWSSGFSTKSVIAAIFPLLDRGEVSNGGDSTLIENVIADNLLQDGSYRAKRLFVMSVLNAVVLCKPEGLRSLISVVLLSDKVGQEATIEACQKVIPLITQPFGKAFMYNEESNSVFLRAVEMEEQIKRLSEQLLPLFALGTTNIVQTDDVPVVLQK
ncbi:hypothetical protein AGDE_14355 [Angomonas deanei]|uniref:Uncharacterized protein n=1 Tax=Angomonas deanei TaxID=59799 RepID=A0A7G2C7U4_9TRYP|nr:hypothetical protein AGDE_14355 [Angomonas deanei]CAD2215900.1 hypothetical protein, conserved [Angomonas deanei]|eukprot:EPY20999.1 hypothetical protein AGDE_14355 [Angomonas deanei]